jgi:hypothetical protein
VPKFRKMPVEIHAVQFDGSNLGEVQAFVGGLAQMIDRFEVDSREVAEVYDRLHDTWIKFGVGDWIIRGVQGEHYPCVDSVFRATYELVISS